MASDNQQEFSTVSGNQPETEPLWTVVEVARYLQLEPNTVRSMARTKKLPGLKVGRVWRFRKTDVIQALETEQSQ